MIEFERHVPYMYQWSHALVFEYVHVQQALIYTVHVSLVDT